MSAPNPRSICLLFRLLFAGDVLEIHLIQSSVTYRALLLSSQSLRGLSCLWYLLKMAGFSMDLQHPKYQRPAFHLLSPRLGYKKSSEFMAFAVGFVIWSVKRG
ncbi:hypothetical protein GALMADRAFT_1247811 [Galerina marginata CBS 339.88]|uniref:Uncharacterized protein n=1 Tax=Galerina marginata (strain CBS 339.88) TaxID=685588 RepID=A0A067TIE1_GALM3|nr:hypothetical protein GALMADRAFT_1247811 [Galerina marginata CBS 339.88]